MHIGRCHCSQINLFHCADLAQQKSVRLFCGQGIDLRRGQCHHLRILKGLNVCQFNIAHLVGGEVADLQFGQCANLAAAQSDNIAGGQSHQILCFYRCQLLGGQNLQLCLVQTGQVLRCQRLHLCIVHTADGRSADQNQLIRAECINLCGGECTDLCCGKFRNIQTL